MGVAHASACGNLAHTACDFAVDVVAVEILVEVVGGARGTIGVTREEAAREGAEGGDGNVLVPAVGEHLPLFLAVKQVVLALHVDERRPAIHRRHVVHRCELPRVHRGRAEVAHFAGTHRVVQRLHRFLHGRIRIEGMDHVQVDIFRPHPCQRPVDRGRDVLA